MPEEQKPSERDAEEPHDRFDEGGWEPVTTVLAATRRQVTLVGPTCGAASAAKLTPCPSARLHWLRDHGQRSLRHLHVLRVVAAADSYAADDLVFHLNG